MKIIACLLIIAFVCCFVPSSLAKTETADVIFLNGNIYTVNERQPQAEALAVKGERIIFAGSNTDAKKYQGRETRVVNLRGRTVLPGMTDAHYHIQGVGAREVNLNLEGTTSMEDLLARVRARVAQAEPGKWVTGRGWIETFWKPPVFPTRAELDKVSPDNPVFLTRADGHGAVANSLALKIAGINKDTANPFGGEILKDKQTGEPVGMILDAAKELVTKHIPQPTPAEIEAAFLLGVKRSIELGWCEIQNAGSVNSDVAMMRKLYGEGKVKLRIYNAVYGPGESASKLFKDGPTLNAYDHRFTVRTIKVVLDGALGSRGAALLEPYADADTSGFLTEKEANLKPMLEEALRRGVQVETHAIGDRANRTILDLYEQAFKAVPPPQRKIREPRWRVEHAQILTLQDIPRFARLGVIPSMQASHAIGDLFFAPSRLGMERLAGAYAWQSLIKSGSIIAGGSDAPVERGEPMIEFYAAVSRKSLKGFSGEGWHPEQALTREQALKMFTLWPAFAAFEEQDKGSLEVGKLADLTVLSNDIMKIPEPDILKTTCVMTVIGGEVVFQSDKM
ncbi:MAG TPA: amidohydrolase [Pyrinomonadaceae bacterium]|jgi:predicted amidohydrolase YtcJ|nr:amidohydrolase [Pyrinomonadaceae bacterium]